LAELPTDKEIITYCENGMRAGMAYQTLRENGYKARFLNEVIEIDGQGGYRL
jgi:rhodanese-related sulfurtransferase